MLGIPYVIVLGKTLDEGKVIIENNKTGEKMEIYLDNLIPCIEKLEHVRKDNVTLEEII